MEFIRNLSQLRNHHRHCVATVGNFDGVHLGHQFVLNQLLAKGKALQLPAFVITFEPQPYEFFAAKTSPARLNRLREKLIFMRQYGVKYLLCLRFNNKFATISAQDFIQNILIERLAVKYLVVGDDFHFGKNRQGNFATLQVAGQQHGFTVENQHSFILDNERVSSTRIRNALENGDMSTAQKLLGRPYSFYGRVRHGEKRGRTMGYPTANIFLHRQKSPLSGVFAVKLHGIGNNFITGVANLGTRPTFNEQQVLLEVHLFNFNQMIYGRYVEVEFVRKLRDEKRFDSFEDLKKQIGIDTQQAKAVFLNGE
ncbi:MAG: bifunctional riboflavin kinase/FAD synthetase [Thiomargarita sp.]|nr:bifunctional riboflavin kinase/FAD synthetase [Thiomargarita sp.]